MLPQRTVPLLDRQTDLLSKLFKYKDLYAKDRSELNCGVHEEAIPN